MKNRITGIWHSRLCTPLIIAGLGALLLVSLLLGIALGAASMPLPSTIKHLWAGLSGGTISSAEFTAYTVIVELRTPRALLAAIVGAGLSMLGITAQAMVRNPLADPFILGISSGASIGAAAVVATGLFAGFGVHALAVAAFLGALTAATAVYLLSGGHRGMSPTRLILTGVVLSFGFQAITSLLIFLEPRGDAARTVMFWLLGSLGGATWQHVPIAAISVALIFLILLKVAPAMDILSSGDAAAASMGVNPRRLRGLLFLLTALGTGVLVAVSGTIGFIGLVIPHITRLILGPNHRKLLLIAPLVGATMMVWVDLFSRTITPPRELPLGVVTALIGVPLFLVIMRRRTYTFGGSQ